MPVVWAWCPYLWLKPAGFNYKGKQQVTENIKRKVRAKVDPSSARNLTHFQAKFSNGLCYEFQMTFVAFNLAIAQQKRKTKKHREKVTFRVSLKSFHTVFNS